MAKKQTENPNETKYKITWTTRPPLADAGKKQTTIAVGKAGKKTTCDAIREGHGQVLRVESKKPGGWFWW